MQIQFTTKNKKQLEATRYWLDGETEEILYGGGKAGGKSFLGATLICGDALMYPETHYFIARKERIDLVNFTIPTIHEVFKNFGLVFDEYASFNGQTNTITLHNGSKIFLLACKKEPSDPMFERFGSMQMTRGWIEEAGEVEEAAKANLWLSIGRWKNKEYGLMKKLLITANPKKGWMKRDFIDPEELPKTRKFVKALVTDNPYLPEDYKDSLKNDPDRVRRERLYLGNWDYEDDRDSLISFDALTDAFSSTITKDGQRYMSVDVARLGKDRTVFAIWDGLELETLNTYEKQDTQNTVQKIKDIASEKRIPYSNIIIDEDGVGGGVVDSLFGVRGFVANSSPLPTASQIREKMNRVESPLVPKTNFSNLKAQCAYKLAELINERKIAFRVPQYRDIIIEELSAILRTKDVDSDGKLAIKSKQEIKGELGKSPDIGDAILFRAWFELKRDAVAEDPNRVHVIDLQKKMFMTNEGNQQINSAK